MSTCLRTDRIGRAIPIRRAIPVETELAHVAVHIIEPPRIRQIRTDLRRARLIGTPIVVIRTVIGTTVVVVAANLRHIGINAISRRKVLSGVQRRRRSCAAGKLPLRFSRQVKQASRLCAKLAHEACRIHCVHLRPPLTHVRTANLVVGDTLHRARRVANRVRECTWAGAHHELPLTLGQLKDADVVGMRQCHLVRRLVRRPSRLASRGAHRECAGVDAAHHEFRRLVFVRPAAGRDIRQVADWIARRVHAAAQVDDEILLQVVILRREREIPRRHRERVRHAAGARQHRHVARPAREGIARRTVLGRHLHRIAFVIDRAARAIHYLDGEVRVKRRRILVRADINLPVNNALIPREVHRVRRIRLVARIDARRVVPQAEVPRFRADEMRIVGTAVEGRHAGVDLIVRRASDVPIDNAVEVRANGHSVDKPCMRPSAVVTATVAKNRAVSADGTRNATTGTSRRTVPVNKAILQFSIIRSTTVSCTCQCAFIISDNASDSRCIYNSASVDGCSIVADDTAIQPSTGGTATTVLCIVIENNTIMHRRINHATARTSAMI